MSLRYCEACDSSNMKTDSISEEMVFHGESIFVKYEAEVCADCGEGYLLTGSQSKALSIAMVQAVKQKKNLLLGNELRKIRKKNLGISQIAFEAYFDLGKNTIQRWEKDLSVQKRIYDTTYRTIRDIFATGGDLSQIFPGLAERTDFFHHPETMHQSFEVTKLAQTKYAMPSIEIEEKPAA